jgi:hypothetical protein
MPEQHPLNTPALKDSLASKSYPPTETNVKLRGWFRSSHAGDEAAVKLSDII